MAIPKQIFQTFKSEKLPWLTRMHIKRMLRRNREYTYHFYDDERIEKFLLEEFPREYYVAYKSLTVGAAKADFFRYAILYKKGGIYSHLSIFSFGSTPIFSFKILTITFLTISKFFSVVIIESCRV